MPEVLGSASPREWLTLEGRKDVVFVGRRPGLESPSAIHRCVSPSEFIGASDLAPICHTGILAGLGEAKRGVWRPLGWRRTTWLITSTGMV